MSLLSRRACDSKALSPHTFNFLVTF
uniref:Uncharacterized protein n=1 Tax=Anguilla anguilla TaxID=7936 RepID=A0A0E9SSY9_ANGAN